MGKYIRGRKDRDLPDDMGKNVKEIINIKSTHNDQSFLAKYSEEDLNEARIYLRKNQLRMPLQRKIDAEIKMRIEKRANPTKPSTVLSGWFPKRWEAVKALFGKGEMSLDDPETIELLESIDLEWARRGE